MKETYTLVDKHDRKQHFDDGRAAGEAYARASGEDKPVVIKSTEGKGAQFLASTAQSLDRETGDKVFIKDFNRADVAFREGWEKVEREKIAALYERDKAAGVKNGMMRIDGKEVAEVRVYEGRDDKGGTTYDVQYFKRHGSEHGTSFAEHRGLDRKALEAAIGHQNTKAVDEIKAQRVTNPYERNFSAIALSGDRLAYAQGVSPQIEDRAAGKAKVKTQATPFDHQAAPTIGAKLLNIGHEPKASAAPQKEAGGSMERGR